MKILYKKHVKNTRHARGNTPAANLSPPDFSVQDQEELDVYEQFNKENKPTPKPTMAIRYKVRPTRRE